MVHVQAKAKELLIHVDEMLDDCFHSLGQYTGIYGTPDHSSYGIMYSVLLH